MRDQDVVTKSGTELGTIQARTSTCHLYAGCRYGWWVDWNVMHDAMLHALTATPAVHVKKVFV